MNHHLKNHIKLHFIVFIYGFTAIIGKLITLPAPEIVLYRMFIAFLALGLFLKYRNIFFAYPPHIILQMAGVGVVVAFHWITFFHAVKISNVSVTLGCLASTTLFTSILEPIIIKRQIKWLEVVIGIIIIAGLYIIFQFEIRFKLGIITALISAFLAALFTVLNKVFISKYHPVSISFYEMGSGFLTIVLFLLIKGQFSTGFSTPTLTDWIWLVVLGVVCTAYAFVTTIDVMKVLSAYTVVLTINMEPVYGIIMAFFIFKKTEFMSAGFYLGTFIILLAIFLYPVISKRINWRL